MRSRFPKGRLDTHWSIMSSIVWASAPKHKAGIPHLHLPTIIQKWLAPYEESAIQSFESVELDAINCALRRFMDVAQLHIDGKLISINYLVNHGPECYMDLSRPKYRGTFCKIEYLYPVKGWSLFLNFNLLVFSFFRIGPIISRTINVKKNWMLFLSVFRV